MFIKLWLRPAGKPDEAPVELSVNLARVAYYRSSDPRMAIVLGNGQRMISELSVESFEIILKEKGLLDDVLAKSKSVEA